jgi:hypothetical protein
VGDWVYDVGTTYDSEQDWLGVAIGALHDEGISRAPTPYVFFRGLDLEGHEAELTLAGPIFSPDEAIELHPAALETGVPTRASLFSGSRTISLTLGASWEPESTAIEGRVADWKIWIIEATRPVLERPIIPRIHHFRSASCAFFLWL